MAFYPFSPHPPSSAEDLPFTLISLEDWAIVTLSGEDSEKYLQSQITVDIHGMSERHHLLGAHCDPKGKMWSNLRFFRRNSEISLIERRSLRNIQLIELKKYAVFSKVSIFADDRRLMLGVAGFQARDKLNIFFDLLPDSNQTLVNEGETSLLWFEHPSERFLLVITPKKAQELINSLRDHGKLNNSQQWLALNIEAGDAIIDLVNSKKFIPQAINLQALGGISFKKGCYIGQEMVARAKFRGTNKRALWCLSGYASRIPEAGENLEMKIDKSWRRTGVILASVRLKDGRLLVQTIMNNDIKSNEIFRVYGDCNTLYIKPLLYSLNESS